MWWCFASLSFFISSSKCSGLLEGIYFDEQPLRPSFRPFPAICKDCHAVATSTSNYCCTSSTPSTTTNQTTNWQMNYHPISSFSNKITNQLLTNNYCCTSSMFSTTTNDLSQPTSRQSNHATNQKRNKPPPTTDPEPPQLQQQPTTNPLLKPISSFTNQLSNQPFTTNHFISSPASTTSNQFL